MSWKTRLQAAVRALQGAELNERIVFPDCIRVQSPEETIRVVSDLIHSEHRGAYLRFGDGEVNLLDGRGEAWDQRPYPKLAEETKEAFSLCGPDIVKSLMIHSPRFGIFPEMNDGIHGVSDEWAEALLSRCYQYFIGERIYSHAALAYLAVFQPSMAIEFLRLLKSRIPIFVGNRHVPPEIVTRLFGNTRHIKTPAQNAYDEIDRIEQQTLENLRGLGGNWKVVVVAMGAAGKILQKRLYHRQADVFSFDFGSLLDAFCGWNTRAWMDLAVYDVRKLLEEL